MKKKKIAFCSVMFTAMLIVGTLCGQAGADSEASCDLAGIWLVHRPQGEMQVSVYTEVGEGHKQYAVVNDLPGPPPSGTTWARSLLVKSGPSMYDVTGFMYYTISDVLYYVIVSGTYELITCDSATSTYTAAFYTSNPFTEPDATPLFCLPGISTYERMPMIPEDELGCLPPQE